MARDDCKDCERHFPGGEGLTDGRCPPCYADFQDRQKAVKKAETKTRRKGEEE